MKKKSIILATFKGLIVGASMMIPGVSGGTMAIILGIYNDLIHAVNNFFKEFKKSFLLLAEFCIGAVIGFLLFSRLLSMVLDKYELPTMYFFIGTILGGVPLLFKQTNIKRNDKKSMVIGILALIAGGVLVLSLGYIPKGSFEFNGEFNILSIVMQLITGVIIAVALVLPGISTSHMLLVLGMYSVTLAAFKNPFDNIVFLLSLAISVVIGIFLTTNILEKAMTKFPQITYFVIIGFVLGSIIDVFPRSLPNGFEIVICIITLTAGFSAIRYISRFSNDN